MKLSRLAGWPFRRILNPRIEWVIAAVREEIRGNRPDTTELEGTIASLRQTIAELQEEVHGLRGDATHQYLVANESLDVVRERMKDIDETLADVGREYQIPPLDRRGLADLRWPVAEFINWANGDGGYAGQAGLWINNPVYVSVEPDGVYVRNVNERIVELPFAFAALADLPESSRILDVGGAESTLGLSLASLGHDVTIVDPRGFPIEHPRVTVASVPFEELTYDGEPFDAAVVVSSVEHFGVGAYGQPDAEDRLDVRAMRDLRERLRPGGRLVLTVPFGAPSEDDFQRVYDAEGLDRLLEGWEVQERTAAWRRGTTVWERGDLDAPDASRADAGVALVRAVRPAD